MTGTEPEIVPFEDVPQATPRTRAVTPSNPLFESVRKLYESMSFTDGEPTDRSAGAGKISVPDADVRRHLRWLWSAGDDQAVPVTVKQRREPDPSQEGHTIIWYWTVPKERKGSRD